MSQLEMYVGDTKQLDIAVTQDLVPVDITGWTFEFTASTSLKRTGEPPITFTVDNAHFTIVDAAAGTVTLTIPAEATAPLSRMLVKDTVFSYALVGTEGGGAIHTLVAGQIGLRLGADDMVPTPVSILLTGHEAEGLVGEVTP